MDKKYVIIILLVIVAILLAGLAYMLFVPQTEYVTVNTVANGTTMEIPKDMVLKSNNNDSGITVLENDNTIVIVFNSANKNIAQIVGFSDIKNPIFGSEFDGNLTLKDPVVAGCSLDGECNAIFIGNNETHDNIIVISKDVNIVNHIINSIKWKSISADESTNTSVASSTSSPSQTQHYDAYCQYCGKGIIWPSQGERWYVCDDCMKTHEKDITKRLEEEYESNYEQEYDSDYEDDEESLV